MKILVTGFEPFGGEERNPSWEAVSRLPEQIGGADIVKKRLPVEYRLCGECLEELVERERPDVVLCVGQAGGRSKLTPEFVALNVMDAQAPDNAGVSYGGERIVQGGPIAYEATVPVREMVRRLDEAQIPAKLSYSAGAFVCNSLMYWALHLAATKYPDMRAGFIHIPFDEVQAAGKPYEKPFMPLEMTVRGLALCVEVCADKAG